MKITEQPTYTRIDIRHPLRYALIAAAISIALLVLGYVVEIWGFSTEESLAYIIALIVWIITTIIFIRIALHYFSGKETILINKDEFSHRIKSIFTNKTKHFDYQTIEKFYERKNYSGNLKTKIKKRLLAKGLIIFYTGEKLYSFGQYINDSDAEIIKNKLNQFLIEHKIEVTPPPALTEQ